MPAIKASTNNVTDYFNLDGLDYERGAYVLYYDSVEENSSGVINYSKIRVGLKSKSEVTKTLVYPSLVTDWTDGSTAYSDFDALIADVTTLITEADVVGVSVTQLIGTIIDLSNVIGTYYNMLAANSATTYTFVNQIIGGKAIILINATSEPTITGATKTKGYTFVANESIYLTVWYNGNRVEYYFTEITNETVVDLTALPYGAVIDTSSSPSTIFFGTPDIFKTSTGRYIAKHDYAVSPYDTTAIFYSDDISTNTWVKVIDLANMFWATIFEYNTDLYLLGTTTQFGNIAISKSTDDGLTWSAPTTVITSFGSYIGWHTSAINPIIKDGYLVKAFETITSASFFNGYNACVVFADLTDLMNPTSWSYSNVVTFNGSAFASSNIYTNTSYNKRPTGLSAISKGFLEGNIVQKSNGNLMNVLRLEQNPNSNNAVYLDITWDGVTPTLSTLGSTHNFIEMPGGHVKFQIIWDATSAKHWAVSSVNKYKYFGDNRIENYLMYSDDDCITWVVCDKVSGYTPTIAWETEIPQYATAYPYFIVDGNDILVALRTSDASADDWHNANLFTFIKFVNFRSATPETVLNASLIIDENSERFEDANGISIIKDQSKYYNSPFMLTANNAAKPNWITNGIQFDGASYLRVMHNQKLNPNNGFTVFVVIENLQPIFSRILSKSDGVNDIQSNNYNFNVDGMAMQDTYNGGRADYTTGGNYIFASTYDKPTKSIYDYKNGVNRGASLGLVNGTFVTDHIVCNNTYVNTNIADLYIGVRKVTNSAFFTSKILALHIFPNYMTPAEILSYTNGLNAIYSIY